MKKVPQTEVSRATPTPVAGPSSDLEGEWYRYCNGNYFISTEDAKAWFDRLKADRVNPATYMIGLHPFYDTCCIQCSAAGHFKGKFLGKVRHSCGAEWYVSPGQYILQSISSTYHTGIRAGGGMKDGSKGDKTTGVVNAIVGFMFGAVFRAAAAVVLIPIQAIVSLAQTKSGKQPSQ